MARKQPFHATSVRQHTVVILFFCSYLRTYAPRPTHIRTLQTHILRERNDILNHLQIQIVNRAARATQNRLWVSGGSSVASLNAIFYCPCPLHTYGSHTHTHKHAVSDGAAPIELTNRGARERPTEIDARKTSIHHN